MRETFAGRAEELRVAAFPNDDRLRRISWFGQVRYADRAKKINQPSVLVYLSEMLGSAVRSNPDRPVGGNVPIPRPSTHWVSVGTLTLLRIGDLWQGQRLFHRPKLQVETFESTDINDSTVHLVKAGTRLPDGNYLLPLEEHPWHRENTRSNCTMVTLANGRILVIPAMELIRFYFGSSAPLIAALFKPPLERNCLFNRVNVTHRTGHMFLDLAVGMPRASSEDIARIAGNPHAWTAARHVGDSCMAASIQGEDVHPKARFPLRGRTDLKTHGQWFSRGDMPRMIFLVNRIVACSHPFPFKSLTANLDRLSKGAKNAFADPGASDGNAPGARGKFPKQPRLVEQDGSSGLTPHSYAYARDRYFPDLDHKFVGTQRPLPAGGPSRPGHQSDPVSDLALGSTGTADRRREAILVEALERSKVPAFLKAAIEACLQLAGVKVQLLTGDLDHTSTLPVEMLADEDGVIDDALWTEDNGNSRPRQFGALGVSDKAHRLILVFIESDPLYPLVYRPETDNEDETHAAMVRATKDFLGILRGDGLATLSVPIEDLHDESAVTAIRDWVAGLL